MRRFGGKPDDPDAGSSAAPTCLFRLRCNWDADCALSAFAALARGVPRGRHLPTTDTRGDTVEALIQSPPVDHAASPNHRATDSRGAQCNRDAMKECARRAHHPAGQTAGIKTKCCGSAGSQRRRSRRPGFPSPPLSRNPIHPRPDAMTHGFAFRADVEVAIGSPCILPPARLLKKSR